METRSKKRKLVEIAGGGPRGERVADEEEEGD